MHNSTLVIGVAAVAPIVIGLLIFVIFSKFFDKDRERFEEIAEDIERQALGTAIVVFSLWLIVASLDILEVF